MKPNDSLIIMDDVKQKTICFRLPEAEVDQLNDLSTAERRSRSNLVAKIVKEYLEQSLKVEA